MDREYDNKLNPAAPAGFLGDYLCTMYCQILLLMVYRFNISGKSSSTIFKNN